MQQRSDILEDGTFYLWGLG